jgi:hypothetical protein
MIEKGNGEGQKDNVSFGFINQRVTKPEKAKQSVTRCRDLK